MTRANSEESTFHKDSYIGFCNDLCILIQGEYTEITESVMRHFKAQDSHGALFVLSTWKANQSDVDFESLPANCKVIFSDDPGGPPAKYFSGSRCAPLNIERQRVSTLNGIKESNQGYIAKIRSDSLFSIWDLFVTLGSCEINLSEQIVCLRYGTINPVGPWPLPFHVGDWFYFGERKRVEALFSKSMNETENARYYLYQKKERSIKTEHQNFSRYTPETYFALCMLNEMYSPKIFKDFSSAYGIPRHTSDIKCLEIMLRYFAIIDAQDILFVNLKHGTSRTVLQGLREVSKFQEWIMRSRVLHRISLLSIICVRADGFVRRGAYLTIVFGKMVGSLVLDFISRLLRIDL